MTEIIHGDCLDVMKTFPDNHFSGIVTDPPYGIHFMGNDFDKSLPSTEIWKEAFRITKPGGHILSFGGTRTYHRLTCAIEDAGWKIRDCLMWFYGSGFPKSYNHFGIEGYGTNLKPAYEPIVMAMKPSDGTFKQNAEKWGQAGINIDGCRIPTNGETVVCERSWIETQEGWERPFQKDLEYTKRRSIESNEKTNKLGRWPANLILDEEAARLLDEQSGILKSGAGIKNPVGGSVRGFVSSNWKDSGYTKASSGGASRFFYCAKASSRERDEGLQGFPDKETHRLGAGVGEGKNPNASSIGKNSHPTVKPLALMRYLITLISPPTNALILDPFCGSGTTILAAKQLGVNAIGIEKIREYYEIAQQRASAA